MSNTGSLENVPLPAFLPNSANFPAKLNPSGRKTPTICLPVHTNYDYMGTLLINIDLFHTQYYVLT